jgi:hypothetical protein
VGAAVGRGAAGSGAAAGGAAAFFWAGELMILLGMGLSIPASLLAAWAPSVGVLVVARLAGGLSAGMAYPTTLALITALWAPGPARTKSIALWSAVGGGMSALGPLASGAVLEVAWWGAVFLLTLPLAVVALFLAFKFLPAHVNESTDRVDNLGGVLSALTVGGLVLGINVAPVPGALGAALGLLGAALVFGIFFYRRQRRVANPLYDLDIASRRLFWVAALGGIIVFGSLMGAMFIGQQYLQNVLDYSTLEAGAAILPGAIFMVLVAPRSAKLVEAYGARVTLLSGYVFCLLGFVTMLLLWDEGAAYWRIGLGYAFVGIGVGLAGTPASHSLTGSVPVRRAGMASGTADLQRDLGGALMQSIMGALLTAGFAAKMGDAISSSGQNVTESTQAALTKSFAGAAGVAEQHPQYASQIIAAARESFLDGDQWAYTAGIVAIVLGAVLVFFLFPKKDDEVALLAAYHAQDTAPS